MRISNKFKYIETDLNGIDWNATRNNFLRDTGTTEVHMLQTEENDWLIFSHYVEEAIPIYREYCWWSHERKIWILNRANAIAELEDKLKKISNQGLYILKYYYD